MINESDRDQAVWTARRGWPLDHPLAVDLNGAERVLDVGVVDRVHTRPWRSRPAICSGDSPHSGPAMRYTAAAGVNRRGPGSSKRRTSQTLSTKLRGPRTRLGGGHQTPRSIQLSQASRASSSTVASFNRHAVSLRGGGPDRGPRVRGQAVLLAACHRDAIGGACVCGVALA